MSDVTVADPGGAPPAAPVNEVVVEPNPASAPQPVGNQAPEKSDAERRRESIQAAYDRAAKNAKPVEKPEREKPKPAEAKPGHNKPPEETKPEGIDLKKRPDQQQHREQGRFARAPDAQPGQQQQAPVARKLPEGAPYRDPPPRMAEHAKRDWDTAPESVRGEFHRLAREAGEMYRQYRGDHEAMNPIRHFHQMAQQHGTTLERALNNYVSMEQKLRADPIGGLDVIVNNLNLRTPDGQRLTFRDIAYHVLSQTPEAMKLMQQSNAQSAAAQQIGALHAEIAGLKNHLQQVHTQQQFVYTRSAVDQFADQHPRFDELGDLIEQELKTGYDLPTAYRRAELLRPSTQAAQTRTPPAQTRTFDKSISGAPAVAPSTGAARKSGKAVGRREAIQNAVRHFNGGL